MADKKDNFKTTMPGKPPRWYSKDKSIGLFILRYKDCIEALRGRIDPKGDVYIFFPRHKDIPFHESFHILGEFHHKIKGNYEIPILGQEDLPLAFKQAVFKLNLTPCFCLRRGKRLNSDEIKKIIQHLIKYLPEGTEIKEVVSSLEERGFYRAHISTEAK